MAVLTPAPVASPAAARVHPRRSFVLLGVAILAVGLMARLALLTRASWLLEGDDSLSTLMGLGILHGDHPVMLKNQTYAGAWEPYAMALSYAVFGISRISARLPILCASLALIGSVGFLARSVAGRAAGWFAALFLALPPAYVLVLSLKPWAPYTEVMVLGCVCLACAVRLAFPRLGQDGRLWALGCGLAGGAAFWLHPLAVFYLVPAALVVVVRARGGRLVRTSALGLAGFLVGASPFWIYNLRTAGATLRFMLAGTSGQAADRGAVLGAWWGSDLPRGIGLWNPWASTPAALQVLLGVVYVAAIGAALVRRRRFASQPLDAILLLLLAIPTLFVLSGFGGPALNPWGFDATGRYAPPIFTGLAVLVAALCARLWQYRRAAGAALAAAVLAVNLLGIGGTNPLYAFQSPYWAKLPADNAPLLQTLRDQRIADVWLNHWAGFPLMFDAAAAGQPLIAYDWYDVQAGGIDRFPEYLAMVRSAARPAFVLVTDEQDPALTQRLRQMGVQYQMTRVPPYVVVVPTSRKVDPSEVTDALDYRY